MGRTQWSFSNSIDLVYLWVDGADKKWLAQKKRWLPLAQHQDNIPNDSITDARWRDNDELKYSLRSVDMFVPWIRHIFIVTADGRGPKWLKSDNTKITMVSHADIMPTDALPTFNSNAIEMCIMNIPGLSEHFLLANDDVFFNAPLGPDYFFDRHGRSHFRYTKSHINPKNMHEIIKSASPYRKTLIRSGQLIERETGVHAYGFAPAHSIDPYIKSSMIECAQMPGMHDAVETTIRNKFRTEYDVQRLAFNLFDYATGRSRFILARPYHTSRHEWLNRIYNFIHARRTRQSPVYAEDAIASRLAQNCPPIICINDCDWATPENMRHNAEFLATRFPKKSVFEK